MCRECELMDFPTAGWPWRPCATPPARTHDDRADDIADLVDAIGRLVSGLDLARGAPRATILGMPPPRARAYSPPLTTAPRPLQYDRNEL